MQPGSLIIPQANNTVPGQQPPAVQSAKRFASAGCDNLVKIWGFRDDKQEWVVEDILEGHTDWVRDVAWAPNIGLPRSYIATASQVRRVSRASRSVCGGERPRLTRARVHAGQDRSHLDKRLTHRALDKDRARPVRVRVRVPLGRLADALARGQVPGRRVARVVVARGQHPRRQLRRRQGHALEGEPQGRVGVRERHDELNGVWDEGRAVPRLVLSMYDVCTTSMHLLESGFGLHRLSGLCVTTMTTATGETVYAF